MSDLNNHKYQIIDFSHEEIEFLLNKIQKGFVLNEAEYSHLNNIGIKNISTFDGNYNNLYNLPDLDKEIRDIIKDLNLPDNVALGDAIEALKEQIDITIQILDNEKADEEHNHNDFYFTKEEIRNLLNEIDADDLDLSKYVTLEVLNNMLQNYSETNHNHSIENIKGANSLFETLNEKADLVNVYNKDEIGQLLLDVASKEEVDELFSNVASKDHEHELYLTKENATELYYPLQDGEAAFGLIETIEDTIETNDSKQTEALNNAREELETSINNINNSIIEFENKTNGAIDEIENYVLELDTKIDTTDAKIESKANKEHEHENVYTKSEIDKKLVDIASGGSINLDGFAKQEDLTRIENELESKANKDHTHSYAVEDIKGLQEILDNKANKDDTVEVPENIMELINQKADKGHEHTNYAVVNHEHDNYANVNHEHNNYSDKNHGHSIENINELQNVLDQKADVSDILTEADVIDIIEANVKVDSDHEHEEYAAKEHTHTIDNISGLNDKLNNKVDVSKVYLKEDIDKKIADMASGGSIDLEGFVKQTDLEIGLAMKADSIHNHELSTIEGLQDILDQKADKGEYATSNDLEEGLLGKADSIHSHDATAIEGLQAILEQKADKGDYATSSDLEEGLLGKADSIHNHEMSEINGLNAALELKANIEDCATKNDLASLTETVNKKADAGHVHDMATVQGLQEALNQKADKGDYITQDNLEDALAKKAEVDHDHDKFYAPLSHSHNDLYYTKDETSDLIDERIENKSTEILTEAKAHAQSIIDGLTQGAPDNMNTFTKVASAIQEHNNEFNTYKNSMESTLSGKADATHFHTEYATIQSEEEREIFTTTELTVSTLGGITAGSNLNGLTVKEILNKLLFPYIAPTISISGTPNGGTFEKGNNQTIKTVKVVVTKKSEKINKIEVLQGSNVLVTQEDDAIANGGTFTYTVDVPVNSANVQLTGKVTDASGTVRQSQTQPFTFVYPYYVGVCDEGVEVNEDLIKGLTKRIESKGTKVISYTSKMQRMIFAYPKTYGVIKKILDANSFDVTSTFTRMEVSITGLDGTAQTYYVYINGASSVEGFTMTFNY